MHYVAYLGSKKLGKTLIFENNMLNECRVSDAASLEYVPPFDGLPGGTRTPDLRLRRPLLYPVELRADKKGPGT